MPGHLIHVGFAKAGSTALGAWFDAHPQMAYAPNGLGGFYHAFDLAAFAAGESDPPLWHVTSGESLTFPRVTDRQSPRAADAPVRAVTLTESRERVCRMLRALYGGATILIVTRGFRSAMLSGYSQYVKAGGRRAVTELRPDVAAVAEALDYDAVLALYEAAFGREQVIALPYELLRDDPQAFLRALESRLGLESGTPLPVRNPALSPGALVWQRRLTLAVAVLARALPEPVGERLFGAYQRLSVEDRLRRPLELVERVVPGSRDGVPGVAPEILAALRGRAASLAGRPFYDRFASEYLND
jgi:hypothetical protein